MTEHFQYMRLPKRIWLPQGFLIICLCLTEKILRVSYRNLDIRFFSGMEMLRGKLRAAETAAYFRRYSLPDCACGHQTAHNHYDERRASVTC